MSTISALQRHIGEVNIANGWRKDDTHLTSADKQIVMLALIGTEVSEAIEEVRNGHSVTERHYSGSNVSLYNPHDSHNPDGTPRKPEGVPSELADVVIRALDCADAWGIDLGSVIEEKLAFNATRGKRHGGKVA